MDIIEANECLWHSYRPLQKGTFNNQEVGGVEGEPQAPIVSPAEAAATWAAIEKLPQQPPPIEETWGKGFEQEFAAIKGFQEDPVEDSEVEVINEDEAIEEASEES